MTPEQLAIKFHETYERLAPKFGYETRQETRAFDPTTANGQLMIAVCGELMNDVSATPSLAQGWRPEVLAFADAMESKLRANDHKGGWKNDINLDLYYRMEEEGRELLTVIATGKVDEILGEAADVANFAMMIADVCGVLNTRRVAAPTPPALGDDPFPIQNPCSVCGVLDGHAKNCPESVNEPPDAMPLSVRVLDELITILENATVIDGWIQVAPQFVAKMRAAIAAPQAGAGESETRE